MVFGHKVTKVHKISPEKNETPIPKINIIAIPTPLTRQPCISSESLDSYTSQISKDMLSYSSSQEIDRWKMSECTSNASFECRSESDDPMELNSISICDIRDSMSSNSSIDTIQHEDDIIDTYITTPYLNKQRAFDELNTTVATVPRSLNKHAMKLTIGNMSLKTRLGPDDEQVVKLKKTLSTGEVEVTIIKKILMSYKLALTRIILAIISVMIILTAWYAGYLYIRYKNYIAYEQNDEKMKIIYTGIASLMVDIVINGVPIIVYMSLADPLKKIVLLGLFIFCYVISIPIYAVLYFYVSTGRDSYIYYILFVIYFGTICITLIITFGKKWKFILTGISPVIVVGVAIFICERSIFEWYMNVSNDINKYITRTILYPSVWLVADYMCRYCLHWLYINYNKTSYALTIITPVLFSMHFFSHIVCLSFTYTYMIPVSTVSTAIVVFICKFVIRQREKLYKYIFLSQTHDDVTYFNQKDIRLSLPTSIKNKLKTHSIGRIQSLTLESKTNSAFQILFKTISKVKIHSKYYRTLITLDIVIQYISMFYIYICYVFCYVYDIQSISELYPKDKFTLDAIVYFVMSVVITIATIFYETYAYKIRYRFLRIRTMEWIAICYYIIVHACTDAWVITCLILPSLTYRS